MSFYTKIIILTIGLLTSRDSFAQQRLLSINGKITNINQQAVSASIYIKGTSQHTTANAAGWYSIVAKGGQTIVFTQLGMKQQQVVLPDSAKDNTYTLSVTMDTLTETLEEVVVGPWLNRDNLSASFLAMPTTENDKMTAIAQQNLEEKTLLEMGKYLENNAMDNTQQFLDKRAVELSQQGQLPSMNLGSPLAWAELFRKKKGKKKAKLDDKEKRLLDIMAGENP